MALALLDAVTAIANGAIALCGEGDRECPVQVAADGNSFMASLLGLGGISDKMQDMIRRVSQPIEKAIDWAIEQVQVDEKDIALELSAIKSR